MSLNRLGALFSSAILLACTAVAQDVDVVRGSFGVAVAADGVRAGGPDYSARFDARGVEFTPVLGRAAERPFPVRFTMEEVRRGANDVFVRTADVEPAVAGNQVRYVHGSDLTEVYDVRADGIEQSFVFATKPAGTGDLVVRGRITTELPLAFSSDDGVRYELPGTGGVTFGAVTGIDANGATARGSIRVIDGGAHVEWVLPAAFVEHARYPLVLDPLIGATFLVDYSAGQVDSDPDVAFDAGTSRYLVVWKVSVSATDDEVRGRLVGPTGTLLGSLLVFSSTVPVHGAPSVASVNTADRFLVTWSEDYLTPIFLVGSRVVMVTVSAATGALSTVDTVAAAGQGEIDSPRVGGDSRPTGVANRYACIVYRRLTPGSERLESRGVQVLASVANASLVGVANVVTNGIVSDPSITKHAGTVGNWITAWVHGGGVSGPHQDVSCRVIGAFGVPCSAVKPVNIGVASSDVEHTSCATSDGSDFAVAWEDEVADHVRVRPLSFTGACPGTFSSPALQSAPVDTPGDQSAPAIEFCKDKYVLTWLSDSMGFTKLYAKGLLPVTCASCGVENEVATGNAILPRRPSVVSRWSGGDTVNDEALIVWWYVGIRGRRFEAVGDDRVTAMGGACSLSGFNDFATYNGDAVIGATDFDLVLANPVSLPLVLVLGFGNLSAPCGSCTIVPTLDILLPAINPYPLDLPCDATLVGVNLHTQWVLLKPSDCPILPDLAFSAALRFTIGE